MSAEGSPRAREIPPSLHGDGTSELWGAVRAYLDRHGPQRRGTITYPPLSFEAAHMLTSLLGKAPGSRLSLAALEERLVALRVGADLSEAITNLGAPPAADAIDRRAQAERRRDVDRTLRSETATWPEPWRDDYLDELSSTGRLAGLTGDNVAALLGDVRRVLDATNLAGDGISPRVHRSDLAARLFGDAHSLDDGTLRERAARLAIAYRLDQRRRHAGATDYPSDNPEGAGQGRVVWAWAGVDTDRVSAPVLTWNLPLDPKTRLATMTRAATSAGAPLHLSLLLLHLEQIVVADFERPIRVVENPRIVEAAAERHHGCAVIATNGQPSTAVNTLIDALLDQGCDLSIHADFDAAGIGICRRFAERGLRPWRMNVEDYRAALAAAHDQGVELPRDPARCGPTPWSRDLEPHFDQHRGVVHEERLLDFLLA